MIFEFFPTLRLAARRDTFLVCPAAPARIERAPFFPVINAALAEILHPGGKVVLLFEVGVDDNWGRIKPSLLPV